MMNMLVKGLALLALVGSAHGQACSDLPSGVRGDGQRCQTIGGLQRCWYPSFSADPLEDGVNGTNPLVVFLPGYSACVSTQPAFTGFSETADAEGFTLVYPQGAFDLNDEDTSPSWNAGTCCGQSRENKEDLDDVAFIRVVIQDMIENDNIDPSRIYIAGHSNGCALAQRLALDASDLITAMACHSFYALSPDTDYITTIPIMEIHGTEDATVNYDEVAGGDQGAVKNAKEWAVRNGCNAAAITTTAPCSEMYERTVYQRCGPGDDQEVTLVSIAGGDHFPFDTLAANIVRGAAGLTPDFDTTKIAWDFMSQYQREDDKIVKVNDVTLMCEEAYATPAVDSSASAVKMGGLVTMMVVFWNML